LGADPEASASLVTAALSSVDTGVKSIKEGVYVLVDVFAMACAGALLLAKAVTLGQVDWINDAYSKEQEYIDRMNGLVVKGADQLTDSAIKTSNSFSKIGDDSSAASSKVDSLGKSLSGVPEKTSVQIAVETKEFDDWKKSYQASSDAFNLSLKVNLDKPSFQDTEDTFYGKFGGNQMMKITTELDGTTTIEAVNKFNSAFPKETKVDIKPDITATAVAEIKSTSDIVQKSIEWKAKIDIAEIDSGTKAMEAAFKAVDDAVVSTGKTISDLSGTYATLVAGQQGGTAFIEEQIREANARADAALLEEQKLVDAQIDNLKARTNAMQSGQAMIQIDGKGLQPQLEAFMYEILKAIQVKANAEGAQLLVGM
jgi:hypothetical protein